VNVLVLSLGGGGGSILRSLKTIFQRDLMVTQKTDAAYAARLRRRVATRFLDTNEFSLADVPPEERLLIGATTTRRLGARHNPDVARGALEESRRDVEKLLSEHSAVILIGTGGKGTGAGTMFPVAEMARRQKKLVIPVFVRPSFERHEVEKRRYDHALKVVGQFDAAKIRLIEILNDRGYTDADPLPQSVVWERMNLPIARGLRGLLYVLEDLSQVDPSDLSTLFAGHGRLRLGFAEIDPPAGQDPSDEQIDNAVRACCHNPYDAFERTVGTTLICIQGHWSNVADAKIKGRLGSLVSSNRAVENSYNPLYARSIQAPKPWGLTALLAEYTGTHQPLDIAWTLEPHDPPATMAIVDVSESEPDSLVASATATEATEPTGLKLEPAATPEPVAAPEPATAFASFWEFALALNRGDAAAVTLAKNGSDSDITIDGNELRKLLATVWFRSIFARLSESWRDRLFRVLTEKLIFQDQVFRIGRHQQLLSEMSCAQLNEIDTQIDLPDVVRTDVQLLVAVGRLWGEQGLRRCQFTGDAGAPPSKVDMGGTRSFLPRR
jgi:cell division GTPase FtsZ